MYIKIKEKKPTLTDHLVFHIKVIIEEDKFHMKRRTKLKNCRTINQKFKPRTINKKFKPIKKFNNRTKQSIHSWSTSL